MADFEIIDAHVHPYISQDCNLALYGHPANMDEFVAELKRCGVSRCCGSVIRPSTWATLFEEIHQCNLDAFAIRDQYPDFYVPGVLFHASFPEQSCADIEYFHREKGLRWIGEQVPYKAGTESYDAPSLLPVYDLAQELELPVNLHFVDISALRSIMTKFPKLNIIMAHPGEKKTLMEKLDLMEEFPHCYLDFSGTGLFRWGMGAYCVRRLGSKRFLYGSDFPVCSSALNVGGLLGEHISDAEKQDIFSGNFRRLTKMALA